MSNYKTHALDEFRAAGWLNEDGSYKDEMQQAICEHVLKLLDVFAGEGHSGSSAPYAINMFSKLAAFEPLVPLTGEDWEWNEVHDGVYQNKRCSHVFKQADRFDTTSIIALDIGPNLEVFAKLIVEECARLMAKHTIKQY